MPKRVDFTPLPLVEPLEEDLPPGIVAWRRCVASAKPVKKCAASAVKKLLKLREAAVARLGEQSETALATLAWASCSIGMTVLNKLAVNRTRAPIAVVIVQMLATCAMAVATRNLHFGPGWKIWAMSVPPLFVLMMVSSMLALQYVTVGTFVVVRNLGPIVTLAVETALHRPDNLNCDAKTTASLLAIAVGVWLYESHEVKLSPIGCFYLLANLAFACAERMLQRHLLAVQSVDVSKPALMLLNNGIGALLACVVLAVFEPKEWHYLAHAIHTKVPTARRARARDAKKKSERAGWRAESSACARRVPSLARRRAAVSRWPCRVCWGAPSRTPGFGCSASSPPPPSWSSDPSRSSW